MSTIWNAGQKTPERLRTRQYIDDSRRMPLWKRRDAVLFLALTIVLITVTVFLLFGVSIGSRDGLFEGNLVRPLSDERILENIRKPVAQPKFLSAVNHEGNVFITQEGGIVHRYNPLTELWSTERPFTNGTLTDPNLTALRSGCGTDPLSDRSAECPDDKTLWAVTGQNGLARRVNGKWDLLISDSVFRGANGELIQGDQLTTAAVSDDEHWLVIGTNEEGIGIYNLSDHHWTELDQDFYDTFASQKIRRVIWYRNAFWVGTEAGVFEVTNSRGRFKAQDALSLPLKVSDMDISPKGELWALGTQPCENDVTQQCVWLGAISGVKQVNVLMNERNRYKSIDLSNLVHAQLWGDRVVMAGKDGIYTYETQTHSWNRLFNESVSLTLDMPGSSGFYFATAKKVGQVTESGVSVSDIPEGPPVQLAYGDQGRVLALVQSGNAYAVVPGGPVDTLFSGQQTKIDPASFTHALPIGKQVLLIGEKGALLHDTVTRTYVDIAARDLPSWFSSPNTKFISSGGYVYALSGNTIYPIPESQLSLPDFYSSGDISAAVKPVPLQTSPEEWWQWGGQGVGVLTESGQVLLVDNLGINKLTGERPNNLDDQALDVAQLPDELAFAFQNGIRYYDTAHRKWSSTVSLPGSQIPVELASNNSRLWAVTAGNHLVTVDGTTAKYVVGDENKFHVTDESLSDVLQVGDTLYLAGAGWIDLYNTANRRLSRSYSLGTDQPVKIISVSNGQPVSTSAGKAFFGEQPIDPEAGSVTSLSMNNEWVWTERQGENGPYLKAYPLADLKGGNSFCLFRTPQVQNVTQVYDARQLPNGAVIVATDAGLFFYQPAARSWSGVSFNPPAPPTRVYLTGKYLVMVSPADDSSTMQRVSTVPLDSISLPDSCSISPVQWQMEDEVVRAVSVNEQSGELLWINHNGEVVRWLDGARSVLLGKESSGPNTNEFRRFYDRGSTWVFTTSRSIWIYSPNTHAWNEIPIHAPSDQQFVDINIEWTGKDALVTVEDIAGNFYTGNATGNSSVNLDLLYSPNSTSGGLDPALLVDVQNYDGGLWSFLQSDRLAFYDPDKREWLENFNFTGNDPTRQFGRLAGNDLITTNNNQEWWVDQQSGPATRLVPYTLQAGETTALDKDRIIWRYTINGDVLRCSPGSNEQYECTVHLPPPFRFDPKAVSRAFQWKSRVWLQFGDTLRIYNPSLQAEEFLAPNGQVIGGLTAARMTNSGLFIERTDDLIFVPTTPVESISSLSYAAEDLTLDASQTPWGKFTDGWKVFSQGDFRSPGGVFQQIFVFEGSTPLALTADNQILSWNNVSFVPTKLTLPAEVRPEKLVGVIPGSLNQWWVLEKDRLLLVKLDACEDQNCLVVEVEGNLPEEVLFASGDEVSGIRVRSGGIDIYHENGLRLQVEIQPDRSLLIKNQPDILQHSGDPQNVWSNLSSRMVILPDSTQAYDAVREIRSKADGKLVAVRPSGELVLSEKGELSSQFMPYPALDAGWLKWERSGRAFHVETLAGGQVYPKENFISEGKLLFEQVDTILSPGGGRYLAANMYGIWTYYSSGLSLDDAAVRFQPVDLKGEIRAAHSRFIAKNGEVAAGGQLVHASSIYETAKDSAVIRENPSMPEVTIWLNDGSSLYPASASNGFLWDLNRRSIAHSKSGALVQTDGGTLVIGGVTLADSALSSRHQNGRLFSEAGQGYLVLGAEWHQWSTGGWQRKDDPTLNRDLLNDPVWSWSFKNGRFTIQLKGASHNFAVYSAGQIGFSSDKLQAAGISGNQFIVASEAFLETAQDPGQFGSLYAIRSNTITTDGFAQMHDEKGGVVLYRFDGSNVSVWDNAQSIFTQASFDPRISGELVASPLLRFSRHGSSVLKEILVENVSGKQQWNNFTIDQGRFPFDVVNSASVFDGQIYLGTNAGLQIYNVSAAPNLSAVKFIDVYGRVQKLGTPLASPKSIMIISEGGCFERTAGSGFQACAAPNSIGTLFRLTNDFWQWVKVGDQAVGRYKDASGMQVNNFNIMSGGGFAHDQVTSGVVCQGQTFSLWKDGWVTLYPSLSFGISAGIKNYPALPVTPEKFLCLASPVDQDGIHLNAGLYAASPNEQSFIYFDGAGWQIITGNQSVTVLQERLQTPPLFESERMRLKAQLDGRLAFEYKTGGVHWRQLDWVDGRVAVDRWQRIILSDQSLWAATTQGLVSFGISPTWQAYLDSDLVDIVQEPLVGGSQCNVTDLMEKDSYVFVRCDSDSQKLFSGKLTTGIDTASFKPFSDADPFAQKQLVSLEQSGIWSWVLKDRENGRMGTIEVFIQHENEKPEKVEINSGQWAFDAVDSLAFRQEEKVELSGLIGGWFQVPVDNLNIKNWRRQSEWLDVNTSDIVWVGMGAGEEGRFLCLKSSAGNYARVIEGKVEKNITYCADYQAEEGFWQYEVSENKLVITGNHKSEYDIRRMLKDGRFMDDFVTGLPAAVKADTGVRYAMTTKAGVLFYNDHLEQESLVPIDSEDPMEETGVVYSLPDQTPAIYHDGKLVPIEDADPNKQLALQLPDKSGITSIVDGPFGFLLVRYSRDSGAGWYLVEAKNGSYMGDNSVFVQVNDLEVYQKDASAWGTLPIIQTQFTLGKGIITQPGRQKQVDVTHGPDFSLITPVVVGEKMIIVGQREVLVINLSKALRQLLE